MWETRPIYNNILKQKTFCESLINLEGVNLNKKREDYKNVCRSKSFDII